MTNDLTYQLEKWRDVEPEARPLLAQHWVEIANDQERIHLEIDHERYLALGDHMAILTARNERRELVGYIASIVSTHLHYATTLHAMTDVFYLLPEYRVGLNGWKLFTGMEAHLKARGVVKIIHQSKLGNHFMGDMLEYLGYKPVETLYAKVV